MKNFKRSISLIIITMLVLSIVGCGKEKKSETSVKIGYLPITHAIPLYIENEVAKGDIELVKFGSWAELMDALNSGKIDGASVLIELAMKAKAQGVDLKAVALGHTDGNAVVVSDEINTAKDIKGKNFAIPNKVSTHNILLYEMLKKENIKINEVNIVELPPSEMAVALQEKRIDGYCVAEPFGAKSVVNGNGKVLKQSSEILKNSICCSLVLRGDFIEKNKAKASEVVSKYVEASKYIEENEVDTRSKAKEFLSVKEDVLDVSLQWISFKKLKIEEADYNSIVGYIKEMNLFDNPPTYEEFIDNSLLEEVK
ncbi:ABC transporter substrate-binding protein [Clostridium cellulovorans]|uniref:NlpA lipoprotein n=1 Tax=Clostridium cellulovorans (strain ATCC 35296 / DSM 3052 / OCM 3 / 743B) TaxID=573061 RepID=D9SQ75_CLOC7|nr:ABC transporter substrate-binding protein [Clostridium cellulovorans]ADL50142.1 NlpA lipoprotein [Clostridium cellulovorans 743B]